MTKIGVSYRSRATRLRLTEPHASRPFQTPSNAITDYTCGRSSIFMSKAVCLDITVDIEFRAIDAQQTKVLPQRLPADPATDRLGNKRSTDIVAAVAVNR